MHIHQALTKRNVHTNCCSFRSTTLLLSASTASSSLSCRSTWYKVQSNRTFLSSSFPFTLSLAWNTPFYPLEFMFTIEYCHSIWWYGVRHAYTLAAPHHTTPHTITLLILFCKYSWWFYWQYFPCRIITGNPIPPAQPSLDAQSSVVIASSPFFWS